MFSTISCCTMHRKGEHAAAFRQAIRHRLHECDAKDGDATPNRHVMISDFCWEDCEMSTRKGKRYTTSYKEKEHPKQDPYAILRANRGRAICRRCGAIYAKKRWHLDEEESRKMASSPRVQKIVCPACQKIRDDYPEGIVTLKWSSLPDHEAEIRGLISNVEARAISINPLARVMKVVGRRGGLEVQTTNDRLAQRIGRELVRAFQGAVSYRWAHRDMLLRVEWNGPEQTARSR